MDLGSFNLMLVRESRRNVNGCISLQQFFEAHHLGPRIAQVHSFYIYAMATAASLKLTLMQPLDVARGNAGTRAAYARVRAQLPPELHSFIRTVRVLPNSEGRQLRVDLLEVFSVCSQQFSSTAKESDHGGTRFNSVGTPICWNLVPSGWPH